MTEIVIADKNTGPEILVALSQCGAQHGAAVATVCLKGWSFSSCKLITDAIVVIVIILITE